MSNIINDKNMPIYVRVSGIEPMERYVKAKNEYEAVARVMEMFREGHRMVVLDVDRVIGW